MKKQPNSVVFKNYFLTMVKWLFDLSIAIIFWQLIMSQACYLCILDAALLKKDAKLHTNRNEQETNVKKN